MAWNEPGPGRDPWNSPSGSGKPGKDGPGDWQALIKRARAEWQKLSLPGGPAKGARSALFGGAAAAVVVLWLSSGFYSVDEQESAVITRFGVYTGTAGPGMRWHLPWPVENVQKVKVTDVRSVSDRSTFLTQDENLIDVEMTVQYHVSSAEDYLFNVDKPDDTLRQALRSAARQAIGSTPMNTALLDGRQAIADHVKQLLQQWLDDYKTGLVLTSVSLQQAQPPADVRDAFADAVKAREDRQRVLADAQAYASDRLPSANTEAARQAADASAYRDQTVARAEGDTARFIALLDQYHRAPEITRQRLYIDAMTELLKHSNSIVVDIDKGNPNFYLPLDEWLKGRMADSHATDVPTTNGGARQLSPPPKTAAPTAAPSDTPVPPAAAPSDDGYRSRDRGSN